MARAIGVWWVGPVRPVHTLSRNTASSSWPAAAAAAGACGYVLLAGRDAAPTVHSAGQMLMCRALSNALPSVVGRGEA